MSIDKLKTKFFTGAWLTDVKHYFIKINEIIDYLNGNGTSGDGSYKEYVALLNQSGTSAPTAIILKNTLGIIPIWTYSTIGQYDCTAIGTFKNNKTLITLGTNPYCPSGIVWYDLGSNNHNENLFSIFFTQDFGSNGLDGFLYQTTIKIRVYN